jgi:hypothetical protein
MTNIFFQFPCGVRIADINGMFRHYSGASTLVSYCSLRLTLTPYYETFLLIVGLATNIDIRKFPVKFTAALPARRIFSVRFDEQHTLFSIYTTFSASATRKK